jgi:hypothetical protein
MFIFRLREKYRRVEHVHHEVELVMPASPRVTNYGSTGDTRSKRLASEEDALDEDDDDDDNETTQLLQLQLERANAQMSGVSMIDFSKHRPMPEAYRSMENLASPRLYDLPEFDVMSKFLTHMYTHTHIHTHTHVDLLFVVILYYNRAKYGPCY